MNNAQRLDDAMWKVERAATDLLKRAFDIDSEHSAENYRALLNGARAYADAMRRLARVARSKP